MWKPINQTVISDVNFFSRPKIWSEMAFESVCQRHCPHVNSRPSRGYCVWKNASLLSPMKRDIVFGLSVRHVLSDFVRVSPPTVFITHKPNLYHLKAKCLECVMRGSRFPYPVKFWRDICVICHIWHYKKPLTNTLNACCSCWMSMGTNLTWVWF